MDQDISRQEDITLIHSYHERTKHRPGAYAAGPDFLDWDDQPNPFRSFPGSERLILPLDPGQPDAPYSQLFLGGPLSPAPLDLSHLSLLLEISLGLSAWKSYAAQRWSLRVNPSSGNLHPTEAYLINPDLPGLAGGVYHYYSLDHALERRFLPDDSWGKVWSAPGVLLGLTSIHWREAWKYGERAFRYCQHDAGHALAGIRLAAASLGWNAVLLEDWGDDALSRLLGTSRMSEFPDKEREAPEALLWIGPGHCHPEPLAFWGALDAGEWAGHANQLSPEHMRWDVIREADAASRKGGTACREDVSLPSLPPSVPPRSDKSFGEIVRQRRSAQRFDPESASLPLTDFIRILDALLPRAQVPPFDLLTWRPAIHPLFFVHRVEGIEPGCYLLPRSPDASDRLRESVRGEFLWGTVDGIPDHIPLRALSMGDSRGFMQNVCCRQAIASQSLFAVAMLAEFTPRLCEGAWWYRWLHWEAGMLGHSLYLEAEVASVRGTGIGCFFDDELHQWLGLSDQRFQSLYHFTVGHPMDDPRLETLPGYGSR